MSTRASQPEAWFEKAEHDLLTIENNLAGSRIPWDMVAFHAQQAAEKYLKGFLVHDESTARQAVELAQRVRSAIRQRVPAVEAPE